MTNEEKFKEVFGIPMDSDLHLVGDICSIIDCPNIKSCYQCPINKRGLDDYDFWESEYKVNKE